MEYHVLNLGAGVQSTCLYLLGLEGKLHFDLVSLAYSVPKNISKGGRPRKTTLPITTKSTTEELHESAGLDSSSKPILPKPPKPGVSDNVRNSPSAKNAGNSSEYRLERLQTQAPEEYDKVLRKEKTINAACIDAGIAVPKIQVNKNDPKQAARILLKHYGYELLGN